MKRVLTSVIFIIIFLSVYNEKFSYFIIFSKIILLLTIDTTQTLF